MTVSILTIQPYYFTKPFLDRLVGASAISKLYYTGMGWRYIHLQHFNITIKHIEIAGISQAILVNWHQKLKKNKSSMKTLMINPKIIDKNWYCLVSIFTNLPSLHPFSFHEMIFILVDTSIVQYGLVVVYRMVYHHDDMSSHPMLVVMV